MQLQGVQLQVAQLAQLQEVQLALLQEVQLAQLQEVQLAQLVHWLMRYLQLSLAQLQLELSDQLQQQSL
jgi:hypothetical protein